MPAEDGSSKSNRQFRCPYCKQTIGTEPLIHCPNCGKTMMVPDSLAKRTLRERSKAKERIHRQMERERSALRIPDSSFARKPSILLLAMAALALTGALLLQRALRGDPPPSTSARVQQAARNVDLLRIALERFRRDCGRYPTREEGLRVLARPSNVEGWQGPYLRNILPDPWEQPYGYAVTNDTVKLFSIGPDGVAGTDDDIVALEPTSEAVNADRTPASHGTNRMGELVYPARIGGR